MTELLHTNDIEIVHPPLVKKILSDPEINQFVPFKSEGPIQMGEIPTAFGPATDTIALMMEHAPLESLQPKGFYSVDKKVNNQVIAMQKKLAIKKMAQDMFIAVPYMSENDPSGKYSPLNCLITTMALHYTGFANIEFLNTLNNKEKYEFMLDFARAQAEFNPLDENSPPPESYRENAEKFIIKANTIMLESEGYV